MKTLRRLSGGGEIALTGSFRGSSPSAPLLDSERARSWLAQLDGVALYVHDDVSFDPNDIELLLQAHILSNALTTGANDAAEPADAGDLPLVVGTPAMLAELLGPAETSSLRIDSVDTVEIRHEAHCMSPGARPLLVASMIVRDEADNLARCLESVSPFVDRIEIVDTGSIDDTIEIARCHGANVTSFDWLDDFSAARNAALDRARDAEFVLVIDADEWVDSGDPAEFRTALAQARLRGVRIPIRNLTKAKVTSEFEAVRVFSTTNTEWVGRVHEYPADIDGRPLSAGYLTGMSISHGGYDPEIVAKKDKHNRNVALAEAAYRVEPSFKTRMDLARSLAWRSDDARAYAMFREAATDMSGANEPAMAYVLAHVAVADLSEGAVEDCHRTANRALALCTGEFVAHLARARAWQADGDDRAIVEAHEKRGNTKLEAPMFDTAAARHMTNSVTVGALARLGRHVEAVELAVATLDEAPEQFDEWKSLAAIPPELRKPGLQLLASMDTEGKFVDALIGEIPMDELASLVLAHVEAGGTGPHTVVTGIMASLIAGVEETAVRIAELGSGALDDEQRSATAERCRLRGARTVADLLAPADATV